MACRGQTDKKHPCNRRQKPESLSGNALRKPARPAGAQGEIALPLDYTAEEKHVLVSGTFDSTKEGAGHMRTGYMLQ